MQVRANDPSMPIPRAKDDALAASQTFAVEVAGKAKHLYEQSF